ncbi:MAG: hypothetical protein RIQ92_598 [Actinomycetota bacterium]|jgi:hypothetical protein
MDDSNSGQTSSTDTLAIALGETMPHARLQSLLGEENFSLITAGQRYIENLEVSARLWIFFNIFEIYLRNSISNQLLVMFPDQPWWVDPEFLLSKDRRTINMVRRQIENRKGEVEFGDVIGGISLGFWTELLSSHYHQRLWEKGLSRAFPMFRGKRRDLHTAVERLRKLRNRIAHHEPILNRDLDYDFNLLVSLIGYMEPKVAVALVENYNTVRC